jgi:hypothetical protein
MALANLEGMSMISIPIKVKERLIAGVKRFQTVISKAKDKDINESDTVTIITDILSDIFGYDKYTEITSEFSIKHTYCDLAIKMENDVRLLIEVKAIGIDLKEQQIKQVVDYGSNAGIDWVILTNSVEWKIYKIVFAKPIDIELVYEFNFLMINMKKQADIELLYYLTREAMAKSSKISLEDYHVQKQLVNRFTIGQLLLTDPFIDMFRRQLKRMSSDIKTSNEEIGQILADEVIKREVLDGEKALDAKKKVAKAMKSQARSCTSKVKSDTSSDQADIADPSGE